MMDHARKVGGNIGRVFRAAGAFLVDRMGDLKAFALIKGDNPIAVIIPFLKTMFSGAVQVFMLPLQVLKSLGGMIKGPTGSEAKASGLTGKPHLGAPKM